MKPKEYYNFTLGKFALSFFDPIILHCFEDGSQWYKIMGPVYWRME